MFNKGEFEKVDFFTLETSGKANLNCCPVTNFDMS